VYHAALVDGEDGGGQLFRGILRTLAKALLPVKQEHHTESQLIPFSGAKISELSEIANGKSSTSISDGKRRRRKSAEIFMDPDAGVSSAKRL
jgi:hypothetical protein